mgnify:CR=1 FL=1
MAGADVSSPTVVVTATSIYRVSDQAPGPLEGSGGANPDLNFRFDPALGPTGGYIFNLSLRGFASGTYAMTFVAGADPTVHEVQFQVK